MCVLGCVCVWLVCFCLLASSPLLVCSIFNTSRHHASVTQSPFKGLPDYFLLDSSPYVSLSDKHQVQTCHCLGVRLSNASIGAQFQTLTVTPRLCMLHFEASSERTILSVIWATASRMTLESAFQNLGPHVGKARFPTCILVLGITSLVEGLDLVHLSLFRMRRSVR